MVKDYPEMTDWVHSVQYTAPFYISRNNYTKLAVDQVQAVDQHKYNVLLLATGKLFDTETIYNALNPVPPHWPTHHCL